MKKHRIISCLLALTLALSLALPVAAAEEGVTVDKVGISNTPTQTFQALGFNTATQDLLDQANDDLTPYGRGAITLIPWHEMMVIGPQGVGYGYQTKRDGDAVWKEGGEVAKVPGAAFAGEAENAVAYRSVSFDPFGHGKNEYTATMAAQVYEKSGTYIKLTISSALPGVEPYTMDVTFLPFVVYPENAGAWMSMAAGNFDGDDHGTQELAVYMPLRGDTMSGSVDIFSLTDESGNLSLQRESSYNLREQSSYYFYDNNSWFPDVYSSLGNAPDWRIQHLAPAVDLAAVVQPDGAADDLCITYSATMGGKGLKTVPDPMGYGHDFNINARTPYDTATGVFFWIDPLTDKEKKTGTEQMRFNWRDHYGVRETVEKNAAKYWEVMTFGGAGAGDINNDELQEVVVAGYNLSKRGEVKDGKDEGDWKFSENEFVATYFLYDPDKRTYTQAQRAMNWVSTKSEDYEDATSIGDGAYARFGGGKDMTHNPLDVTCFAEMGDGYGESVSIGGIICRLDTETGQSTRTPYNPLGSYMFDAGALNSVYAIPIKDIHRTVFKHDVVNRFIAESVAGNFNGGLQGQEQLAFVYIAKERDRDRYSSAYGIIGQKDVGEQDTANVAHDKSSNYLDEGVGYRADWGSVQNVYSPLSVSAADYDDDSIIMRHSGKPNEYYFSDPVITAVLQAPPFFAELEYADTGETSINQTTGTSTEYQHGVTAGMTVSYGREVAGSVFKGGVSTEFTNSWGEINATYYSLAHTAGTENMVALVMTPYVRYHYQTFDPKKNEWVDTTVDTPQPPRSTLITVKEYDDVAKMQNQWIDEKIVSGGKWELIGGNILSSTPGYPTTYGSSTAGKENFKGGKAVNAKTRDDFVRVGAGGSGSMTMSISVEKSDSTYRSWSTVAFEESEIKIGSNLIGISPSLGYTGGYTKIDYDSTDFTGEVCNVPADKPDYSFLWQFGKWDGELNIQGTKQTFPVLGYLVKNVSLIPASAQNFHVKQVAGDSVTLSWQPPPEGDEVQASYIVCRSAQGVYYPLATLEPEDAEDGWFTFTDEYVEPFRKYDYSLRPYMVAQGRNIFGAYGTPLTVHTIPDGNVPRVELTSNSATFFNGTFSAEGNMRLKAEVTPARGDVGPLLYQWQKYAPDQGGWIDAPMEGANTDNLLIKTDEMSSEYRCRVTQRVGKEICTVYSNMVKTKEIPSSPSAPTVPMDGTVTVTPGNDLGFIILYGENDVSLESANLQWGPNSRTYTIEPGTQVSIYTFPHVKAESDDIVLLKDNDLAQGDNYYRRYSFTMGTSNVDITISNDPNPDPVPVG